jgi:Rv0078B-related antitoxin
VPLTDTTPAAQAVQLEIHRSMSGEQRLLLAYEMSMFARELNRARLRREHPEWSEAQIARELLRLAFFPKPLPSGFQ